MIRLGRWSRDIPTRVWRTLNYESEAKRHVKRGTRYKVQDRVERATFYRFPSASSLDWKAPEDR